MDQEFEELVMSWINGNRKYVWGIYIEMTPMRKYDFIEHVNNHVDSALTTDIFDTFLKNYIK